MWLIYCQSYPYRRAVVWLFKPLLGWGGIKGFISFLRTLVQKWMLQYDWNSKFAYNDVTVRHVIHSAMRTSENDLYLKGILEINIDCWNHIIFCKKKRSKRLISVLNNPPKVSTLCKQPNQKPKIWLMY